MRADMDRVGIAQSMTELSAMPGHDEATAVAMAYYSAVGATVVPAALADVQSFAEMAQPSSSAAPQAHVSDEPTAAVGTAPTPSEH